MSKLLITFLVLGLAFAVVPDKRFIEFQDFIIKYDKEYSSIEEFQEKFEIFKQNQKLIKKISPKIQS